MSIDLRKLVQEDLKHTLEGEFGLPVEIVFGNDGVEQKYSANDPTQLLMGRVQYDTKEFNLQTGGSKLLPISSISIRITSLIRLPNIGEQCSLRIPAFPDRDAPKVTLLSNADNQPALGRSIGYITFYPEQIKQKAYTPLV